MLLCSLSVFRDHGTLKSRPKVKMALVEMIEEVLPLFSKASPFLIWLVHEDMFYQPNIGNLTRLWNPFLWFKTLKKLTHISYSIWDCQNWFVFPVSLFKWVRVCCIQCGGLVLCNVKWLWVCISKACRTFPQDKHKRVLVMNCQTNGQVSWVSTCQLLLAPRRLCTGRCSSKVDVNEKWYCWWQLLAAIVIIK